MPEQNKGQQDQTADESRSVPSQAEGDEETIDESLRQKEEQQKK